MNPAQDPRLVPLRDSLAGRVLRGSGGVAYYLRECIGEGGQGWVFRANWDDPAGHVVIVKVLRPDVFATEALRRFQREAEVLRMLSMQGRPNPYIVRFYDHAVAQVPSTFGPDPLTLPFTVLEYVDGTTLEKLLVEQNERGLPAVRVRRLLRQICQALDLVHKQKIVHRDLKPSNILLATEAGTEVAKVTDFGLVKLVDVNLQKTAALAGASLGYAPPEQYEQGNQRVSPKTDVFSLAAVVYEMLSGKPAFPFNEGENPLLIVTRILNGQRPTLMRTRNTLAPELEIATPVIEAIDRELSRALSADPAARHDGAIEFWNAIEPSLLRAAAPDEKQPAPRSHGSPSPISPYDATARIGENAQATGSGVRIRNQGSPPFGVTPQPGTNRDRVSEVQASNPAAWAWTILTKALGPRALRAVEFSPQGDSAAGIGGVAGLLCWERGAWVPSPLPGSVPRASLRGLRWMHDGSVLLFGDGSFVARHVLGGGVTQWRVPDQGITFLGAYVEEDGTTTLVGERPYRGGQRAVPGNTAGVVAQFKGDRVTVIGEARSTTRLRAVTRMAGGILVACGDWGALVRIEMGVVDHVGSICGGHLLSIAPMDGGGAVTIGVGGHALSLSPKLEAQLEAVQTTRDLLSLTGAEDGHAWAGSAQARLLRRSVTAGASNWVRMSGDIGVTSSMIAVSATSRSVRSIGDDGAVVEGRIA